MTFIILLRTKHKFLLFFFLLPLGELKALNLGKWLQKNNYIDHSYQIKMCLPFFLLSFVFSLPLGDLTAWKIHVWFGEGRGGGEYDIFFWLGHFTRREGKQSPMAQADRLLLFLFFFSIFLPSFFFLSFLFILVKWKTVFFLSSWSFLDWLFRLMCSNHWTHFVVLGSDHFLTHTFVCKLILD